MSLPRDDLDLIDALVGIGAISRATAREVVATAEPGKVASLIWERGYCNLCGPGYVIVERLAKAEQANSIRPVGPLSTAPSCAQGTLAHDGVMSREQPETD